jgi:hypothetical protein
MKQGSKIFGFEIDFLIGRKVILEYNGYSHYCINSPEKLTKYFKYKYSRLERMGFLVNLIDFSEWGILELKNKQMELLVNKTENRLA